MAPDADLERLAAALFRVHEDHITDHDMKCWNCGGPLGEYRPANSITWEECIERHAETAEGWRRYAAEVQVYLPASEPGWSGYPVGVIAQTLKRLYPQNPDIVLGREARNIVDALVKAGYHMRLIDGEAGA